MRDSLVEQLERETKQKALFFENLELETKLKVQAQGNEPFGLASAVVYEEPSPAVEEVKDQQRLIIEETQKFMQRRQIKSVGAKKSDRKSGRKSGR